MRPTRRPAVSPRWRACRAASANQLAYDIVVLDLNMPGWTAWSSRNGSVPTRPSPGQALHAQLLGQGSARRRAKCRLSGALRRSPVRQSELFNCLVNGLSDAREPSDLVAGAPESAASHRTGETVSVTSCVAG